MANIMDHDIIWKNGRILTMQPHMGMNWLQQHDIIVRGEKILAIVPAQHYPASQQVIDVKGALITPGLIDCHTHLVFGGNRAHEWALRLEGVSYSEIARQGGGIQATVNATRLETPAQLYTSSLQRLQALMREGVTSIEIKSGYGLDLPTEQKQLEIIRQLHQQNPIDISATLLAAHAVPKEYQEDQAAYVNLVCDQIMPLLWAQGLFEAVDVFCEHIGFNLAQTRTIFTRAHSLGIPVKAHVEQLSNLGGSALVAQFQGLSVDHIEYLDTAGIQALQRSGTVATLLPLAFYFLRERQLPPIEQLRAHQIPMALATDFNPGTAPFASLRLAMNMAAVLFGLTPHEILQATTIHAAQALGKSQQYGQLVAGMQANFVVWSVDYPVEIFYELGTNPLLYRVFKGQFSAV